MRWSAILAVVFGVAACAAFRTDSTATNAGSSDAGLPDAEEYDAADAGTLARTSPCRSPHAFCSDFDDDGLAPWGVPSNSKVTLDTDMVVSPPNALTFRCGNVVCSVSKDLPLSSPIRVEFDLLVLEPQPQALLVLTVRALDGHYIMLRLTSGQLLVSTCTTGCGTTGTLGAPDSQAFHHVSLHIDWIGASPSFAIDFDGLTKITNAPLPVQTGSTITLNFGCPNPTNCPDEGMFRVDNVVVDTL
jgi:hypothetical protein